MVSRILRVCMALLIVFTLVDEAMARTQRGRQHGHVRAHRSNAALAGIVAGAALGGFAARRAYASPLRSHGGGGTRILNIDRSRNTTINRGDANDDDSSDDDTDSGNDDADTDGDAGGSDDGGDD